MVASAGITLGEKTGWFGALRWRYIGARPLTEDDVFRSPPTSIFNGHIGYRFDNGWRIQLDALNLFNTRADQITYAYGSLIKTDSLFAFAFPTRSADRAGGGLPERRDGLCAAPDRAVGGSADDRGDVLIRRRLMGSRMGGSCLMRRVDCHNRFGSWLALAALALQIVVSFGHVHLDRVAHASAIVAVAGAPGSPALPDQQPGNEADDYCAICATIYLAANLFVAGAAIGGAVCRANHRACRSRRRRFHRAAARPVPIPRSPARLICGRC